MAISDNYVPLKELGNGTTTEFSDTWAVLSASFLRVFLEDVTTGVQVLQTEGSDYTLTFDDSGFVVTFLTAPTSANFVVISREVAIDQTVPYTTSKGFQGSVQEGSFDKAAAISQDQQDDIDRSLGFPIGSSAVGSLPTPVDDLFVGWNSTTGAQKNSVKTITEVENTVDSVNGLVAGSGVLVSADDTTVGFLNGKLIVGDVITLTENSGGGDETLTINVPDGTVTNAKLADMVQATIKGRAAAAGTGVPVDLTAAQVRTIVGSASETVEGLVEAATTAEMNAGTANKFPDAAKVRAYADSVPVERIVATATPSGVSEVEFIDIFTAGKNYRFVFNNILPATNAADLQFQLSDDSGVSYFTASVNEYMNYGFSEAGAEVRSSNGGTSFFLVIDSLGNLAEHGGDLEIKFHNPANGSANTKSFWQTTYVSGSASSAVTSNGGGAMTTAEAIDTIRFFMSSGNISSGTITVYEVDIA